MRPRGIIVKYSRVRYHTPYTATQNTHTQRKKLVEKGKEQKKDKYARIIDNFAIDIYQ